VSGNPPATGAARRRRLHPAWFAFAVLLALQVALALHTPETWRLETSVGTPPPPAVLRLASLDEPALAAYGSALYLQGYDAQAGALLPLRMADYPAIRAWLELAFTLDPHSSYPLMLAAFDYSETAHLQDEASPANPPQAPAILEFVERGFRADPAAHWRWLAHAAWVSRYVLHDDARALAEAHLLRSAPAGAAIPEWARELDTYVLGRRDPIEARRALLGGLAAGTAGTPQRDLERLADRIASMEAVPGVKPRNRDAIDGLIPGFPQSSKSDDHR
jgi:hypothetical protein